jgi:hypothetical protein
MARLPKHTDAEILSVLAALKISGGPISGVTLRKELRRCLGAAGGTQRIYRLLKTPPPPPPPLDASEAAMRVAAMQAERDAAVSRAELAELREREAVDRTANQIHDLRQRLRAVGIDPFK